MEITLNWDLFIIVFFLIIVAYSFMIGKYQTLKIILSSYIAILTSDGVGNIIEKYLISDQSLINISENKPLIILKISIFVILTILLATRGAFGISISDPRSKFTEFVMTISFGVLSAGLIISTILVYVSGASLVKLSGVATSESMNLIAESSRSVRMMIENYNIWFSLPAIAFIVSSLMAEGSDE